MLEAEIGVFFTLLDDVSALLMRPGQPPLTPTAKGMYFRALQAYPLEAVQSALDAHVKDPKRGRFMPLPADVIEQLQGAAQDDGRPGPEEAWAIAALASDELDTVVWTDEIAQAYGVARHLQAAGDGVGARMAFKEAYTRIVDDARAARKPVQWLASLGHDPTLRDCAIAQAVALGRLPAPDYPLLPAPLRGDAMVGLMRLAPAGVQESMQKTKLALVSKVDAPSTGVIERERTQELKAKATEALQAYHQEFTQ